MTIAFLRLSQGPAIEPFRQEADDVDEERRRERLEKFVAGPAAATSTMSCLGLRSAPNFTGTGLA